MNPIQEFERLPKGKEVTVKVKNGKVIEFTHEWKLSAFQLQLLLKYTETHITIF